MVQSNIELGVAARDLDNVIVLQHPASSTAANPPSLGQRTSRMGERRQKAGVTLTPLSASPSPQSCPLPSSRSLRPSRQAPSGSVTAATGYVKSTLLPGIRRVAAILSHAATIEWPSVAWQVEKFPGRGSSEPSDAYTNFWLGALALALPSLGRDQRIHRLATWPGHMSSWYALLAAWDEGAYPGTLSCGPGSGCLCKVSGQC